MLLGYLYCSRDMAISVVMTITRMITSFVGYEINQEAIHAYGTYISMIIHKLSQPQNLQFKTAFFCLLFLELLALPGARYPSFPARFPSPDIVAHAIDIHTCFTSLYLYVLRPL